MTPSQAHADEQLATAIRDHAAAYEIAFAITVPSQLLLVVMVLSTIGLMAWAVVAWKRLDAQTRILERPTDIWKTTTWAASADRDCPNCGRLMDYCGESSGSFWLCLGCGCRRDPANGQITKPGRQP